MEKQSKKNVVRESKRNKLQKNYEKTGTIIVRKNK